MAEVVVYGIPNCDTVKRARTWLQAQGVAYRFHDFRKQGLDPMQLQAWIAAVGWGRVLNRQGSTWRRLDDAERAQVQDAASAASLMLRHTSLVKRPLVCWEDGSVSVGFDAQVWLTRQFC